MSQLINRFATVGFASFSRVALSCVVSACFIAAGQASATSIALNNPSFEQPAIALPGPGSGAADIVLPFVPGWIETGVESTEQGFTGLLDSGVFLNIPFELAPGFVVGPVPNADGNQLAYLRYSAAANSTGPATSISQQTTVEVGPESIYTFTIGLGQGQLQPPGTAVDGPPYSAVLAIGYYNNGTDMDAGFTPLASNTVGIDQLPLDGSLDDHSVIYTTTDALPFFDGGMVLYVAQTGGASGSINLDNARFTVVPEPSALATLALGGVLLARRRRR